MAKTKKPFSKIQCTACKSINYFTNKSKKANEKGEKKLEMKKFCNVCRKHTIHKETKR